MITLSISFSSAETLDVDADDFEKYFQKAEEEISSFPKRDVMLSLIFVSDPEIQELNARHRQKNTPTDVLSFPLYEEDAPEEMPLFGEIYISLETAERQASERNHSLREEVNTLFVHGFLHLLGFVHESEKEYREMKHFEKIILCTTKTLL